MKFGLIIDYNNYLMHDIYCNGRPLNTFFKHFILWLNHNSISTFSFFYNIYFSAVKWLSAIHPIQNIFFVYIICAYTVHTHTHIYRNDLVIKLSIQWSIFVFIKLYFIKNKSKYSHTVCIKSSFSFLIWSFVYQRINGLEDINIQ